MAEAAAELVHDEGVYTLDLTGAEATHLLHLLEAAGADVSGLDAVRARLAGRLAWRKAEPLA